MTPACRVAVSRFWCRLGGRRRDLKLGPFLCTVWLWRLGGGMLSVGWLELVDS